MSEYEEEIEYLDEDADVVQQYVQNPSFREPKSSKNAGNQKRKSQPVSLVPRRTRSNTLRRKQLKEKYEEEDSDYVPEDEEKEYDSDELLNRRNIKKRKTYFNKNLLSPVIGQEIQKSVIKNRNGSSQKQSTPVIIPPSPENTVWGVPKMDIRIPDYEDPMCLPVKHCKVINKSSTNQSTLRKWNELCIKHLTTASQMLNIDKESIVRSTRTLVFKKVMNKSVSDEAELSVIGKTTVFNKNGDENCEGYQALLPRYREQRHIDFGFVERKYHSLPCKPEKFTVILNKENHSGKEALVSYKPDSGVTAVYNIVENESDNEESLNRDPNDTSRRYLQETVRCTQCMSCYQHSYRKIVTKNKQHRVLCPICGRNIVSVYNLLKHLRIHSDALVREHAMQVADIVSKVLEYHYKCRVCSSKFHSIRKLRAHLSTHKSKQLINCDLCSKSTAKQGWKSRK